MIRHFLILLFLLVGIHHGGYSQSACGCTNCPQPIPDDSIIVAQLVIDSATSNDLASSGQGVCGVNIEFTHTFIGDLEITLVSPSGQTVTLVGPVSTLGNQVIFTTWDVSFVPCGDPAFPDPGFSSTWSNDQPWAAFQTYTGSYYPFSGCLEDFDMGPVEGVWTLIVEDGQPLDEGEILDFSIIFCDEDGIYCNACLPDAGTITPDTLTACLGDSALNLSLQPDYSGGPPDTAEYGYAFIISDSGIIIDYLDSADLTGFPPGTYEICGFSYFLSDSVHIPPPDSVWTTDSLRNSLNATPPAFCGEIGENCKTIQILAPPSPVSISDTLCYGESLIIGNQTFDSTGNYTVNLPSSGGCDSTILLDLVVLPAQGSVIDATICHGDTFSLTDSIFFTTEGSHVVNFSSGSGCDSLIILNLTVLAPIASIAPPEELTCDQQTIQLDASASSSGPLTSYIWEHINGTGIIAGGNTVTPTVNAPGNFKITVFQANSDSSAVCLDRDTVTVSQNIVYPTSDPGSLKTLDCNTDSVQLGGAGTSIGPEFLYLWSGPMSFSSNQIEPFAQVTGTYSLVTLDTTNGCSDTANVTVTENYSLPNLSAQTDTITCFTPVVPLNGSSPSQNAMFLWTGPGNFSTTSPDTTTQIPGSYQLRVTGSNGCSDSITIQVEIDTFTPDAQAFGDTISCNQTEVQLMGNSATGGISFEWNGPGNFSSFSQNPTVNLAGHYELTVTAPNGCSTITETVVEADTIPPDATATGDTLNCIVQIAQLTGSSATSGVQFDWSGPGGFTSELDSPTTQAPGNYSLLVTAPNGCTSTEITTVEIDTIAPVADAGQPDTITCQQSSVTLNAGNSSQGPEFIYLWTDVFSNPIGDTLTLQISQSGIYMFSVTNTANGCSSQDFIAVPGDTIVPTAEAGQDDTLTCLDNSLTLDGSSSTGSSPLIFTWYDENDIPVGDSIVTTVSVPGLYTLVVTDSQNGCTAADSVNILQDDSLPDAVATASGSLTCSSIQVQLDATGSSIGSEFEYYWLNANGDTTGTGNNITVSDSGLYYLWVENATNGCVSSASVNVDANYTPPDSDPGPAATLTCSDPVIQLDGSASSGQAGILFEWFDPMDNLISDSSTAVVSQAGMITLIVTDSANGCKDTSAVTVTQNADLPTADAGAGQTLTCADTTVTLTTGNSSAGDSIFYIWYNSSDSLLGTDDTLSVALPGDYTLIVTDSVNGCSATDFVTVDENTIVPVADAGSEDTLTCNNLSVMLGGPGTTTGPSIAYEWFDSNAVIAGTNANLEIASAGTYTLVVTDTLNGCSSSDSVNIFQDSSFPVAVAGADLMLTCIDTFVTLDGSGSSSGPDIIYQWMNSTGMIIGNNITQEVDSPGIYSLLITNIQNGCTASDEIQVIPNTAAPLAIAHAGDTLTCEIQLVVLDAEGSSSAPYIEYEWRDANDSLIGTDSIAEVTEPQIYTLTVINTDNGCSAQMPVEVMQDTASPVAVAGADDTLTCIQNTLVLDGSGSAGTTLSFRWFAGQVEISASDTALVSSGGEYTLVVTQPGNGCTSTDTINIFENRKFPVAEAGPPDVLTCQDTTVTLNGSGSSADTGISYQWTNSSGQIIGMDTVEEVSLSGAYFLLVTDNGNGCTAMDSVEIDLDTTPPIADAGTDQTLTCDSNSVELDGSASSSGLTIIYEWTDSSGIDLGSTPQIQINLTGTFILTVTNLVNGCSDTDEVEVLQDVNLPTAVINQPDTLTCDVTSVTLDGSGSSSGPEFSYQWEGPGGLLGQDQGQPADSAGIYILTITNMSTGCSNAAIEEVIENINPPEPIATVSNDLSCKDTLATLDAGQSAGGTNLSYQWQFPAGNNISSDVSIQVDEPGQYFLFVYNEDNGCWDSTSIAIEDKSKLPVVDAGSDLTLNCADTIATLDGSGSSIGNEIIYTWEDILGNIVGNNLTEMVSQPGQYTLTVTDTTTACLNTDTILINQDTTPPIANAGPDQTLTCDSMSVTLDGSTSSTGPTFTYQWTDSTGSGIGTGQTIQVSSIGTVSLTVTNLDNGCQATDDAAVFQDINLPTAVIAPPDTLTCTVTSVVLDGSGSSSGPEFDYQWEGPDSLLGKGLQQAVSKPGTYFFTVSNTDNGCSHFAQVMVMEKIEAPTPEATVSNSLTCRDSVATLDGAASTGGSNLGFEWQFPAGNTIGSDTTIEVMSAGEFTLVLTNLDNGCNASTIATVTENIQPPAVNAGAGPTLNCMDTMVTLDGTGSAEGINITYLWLDQMGNTVGTNLSEEVGQPGNYTLIVTDTTNGCSASDVTFVNQDTLPPIAQAGMDGVLTCSDTSVTLNNTGSSTGPNILYEWANPGDAPIGQNPTVQVTDTGIYTLTVTDTTNHCSATDEVEVYADYAPPSAIIDPDTGLTITCAEPSVPLDGCSSTPTGEIDFSWTFEGDVVSNACIFNASSTGVYLLVVTDMDNGCVDTATVTVIADTDLPQVVIAEPAEITCIIDTVVLDASASSSGPEFSYTWSGPGIMNGGNTLTPTVNAPGFYTLEITNTETECQNSAPVTVLVNQTPPIAQAEANNVITCTTTEVTIDGSGSSQGATFSYQWSTSDGEIGSGGKTHSPIVTSGGTYSLTVTNTENGCTETVTVEVPEDSTAHIDLVFETQDPTCFGETDGRIFVTSISGGTPPYLFSLDGENFTPVGEFDFLEGGSYTLLVQDVNGCEWEESFVLTEPVELLVELGEDLDIELGQTVDLQAQVNRQPGQLDTIIWDPDYLDCEDYLSCLDTPLVTTIYTVLVKDENGCEARDILKVRVRRNNRHIFIPNVFSPDGDGFNDRFIVFGGEDVKNFKTFQIFNRWGEAVYELYNFGPVPEPGLGWNGTFRGNPVNPAVFVYFVEVEFIDGRTEIYEGSVTVIK